MTCIYFMAFGMPTEKQKIVEWLNELNCQRKDQAIWRMMRNFNYGLR